MWVAPGSLASTSPRGPTVDVSYVDCGHSWISVSTCQWVHRRCFLVLMAGAPGSSALAPLRGGSSSTFLSIDDGRSRISSSDIFQGARHRRFLALMVGGPGSPAPPPKGATADVLQLSGSQSHTSSNTTQGATMTRTFLSKKKIGSCTAKDLER
jgi:hypothetical protein